MVNVTYIEADGNRVTADIPPGTSVMEGAVKNGVVGIEAACGGACSCATCHVKIMPEWMDVVGSPNEIEADMLEGAVDIDQRSRLSCQIEVTPAMDGLEVEIPPS